MAKASSSASKRRKSARPARRAPAKPKNTTGLVPFAKGNAGKKPGTKNKLGVKLKEAILQAAEMSGRNGRGKDGAVGYLVWLSRAEPAVFGRMLEKVMPLQVDFKDKTDRTMNAAEAVARLKERGIPVPPALLSLAEGVARAVAERQEADYDAELNGEGFEGADTLHPLQPEGEEEELEDADDEV